MGKLSNLPAEIILEILTRLPTETVLECKLVCKPWRDLVHDPSFSQMHLTHLGDPSKLTFLCELSTQLNYLEYDENNHNHRMKGINTNSLFKNSFINLLGSSNGLICLNARHDIRLLNCEPAYICNPCTKEYVILPTFRTDINSKDYRLYYRFGYLQETNEYKVVRFHQLTGSPSLECVEVYTLGSGKGWRNVGDCGLSCSFYDSYSCRKGVFVRESLYWITVQGKIVSFNLADERFCEISTLPGADRDHSLFRIGVLGGVLWCSNNRFMEPSADVWLVKKNGNQYIMEQKAFLTLTRSDYSIKPLALMKSGEVLCYDLTKLCSYDIKSSRSKTLVEFPKYVYRTVPHMNTLVSLKALGEEDTKTME